MGLFQIGVYCLLYLEVTILYAMRCRNKTACGARQTNRAPGTTPWTGDRFIVRPLPTQDSTNSETTQTNIHPPISTSEWQKTVSPYRAATVTGRVNLLAKFIL
jgi:hypothetical protein